MSIPKLGHHGKGRDFVTRLWSELFPDVPVRLSLLYRWLDTYPAREVCDVLRVAAGLYDPARHTDADLFGSIERLLRTEPQRITELLEQVLT
jgi:hypothetical protein